jgi:orotidine-5'-phosphate decarboxylase
VSEIAIAYDVPGVEAAVALDERLGEGPELAKIGLELFIAAGPEAVRALARRGRRVFLDLKLHDIPNTVRGAAAAAGGLGADLLTVHAGGGAAMIAAAVEGVRRAGAGTRVVAVTVLTSFDGFNLPPGFAQPFHLPMVLPQMLRMAEEAGAAGIVCAARDIPLVQSMHRKPFFAVTPGIRPDGAPSHDQARVSTVAEAVRLGSGMLVVGRAVTGAADPRAALAAVRAERDAALATTAAG